MLWPRKKIGKKTFALICSIVVFVFSSQAFAYQSLENNHNVTSKSKKETSSQGVEQIKSLEVTNGTITLTLSDSLQRVPQQRDFTFTKSIGDKHQQRLTVNNFTWDPEKHTAHFTFYPIPPSKTKQTVKIATTFNNSRMSAEYTLAEKGAIVEKVTIINLSNDNELTVGAKRDSTLLLAAVSTDQDGAIVSGQRVTWDSSNEKVAKVDSRGKVKAVRAGDARITATINGKKDTFDVTVLPAPPTLQSVAAKNGEIHVVLSDEPINEPVLENFMITAKVNSKATDVELNGYHWNGQKKEAQFDFKPFMATTKIQYVTITVEYAGSTKKAKAFRIAKIDSLVKAVQIVNETNDTQLTLGTDDDTLQLSAVALDSKGKPVQGTYTEWRSSNKEIVSVDQTGKVTAIGEGKATITVTIDGQMDSLEVTVKGPEQEPTLELGKLNLYESGYNDGSISGTQTVTVLHSKFKRGITSSDVTVENLPDGLNIQIMQDSNTQLTLTFTGQATRHSAGDSRDNLRVKIEKQAVLGASNDMLSPEFRLTFMDPVVVPPVVPPTPSVTFTTDGMVQNMTYQNVTITAANFTLKNSRVKGNLTIKAASNVTLENVIVDGQTILQ